MTKDLIAHGFGRDVMGLLLAYREQEVEARLQTLHVGIHKVSIVQAQKLLDIIPAATHRMLLCAKCNAGDVSVSGVELGDPIGCCEWCSEDYCSGCAKWVENLCPTCKESDTWCPNCGCDDCHRDIKLCPRCNAGICNSDGVCSRCWFEYIQRGGDANEYYQLSTLDQKNIDNVASRLYDMGINAYK